MGWGQAPDVTAAIRGVPGRKEGTVIVTGTLRQPGLDLYKVRNA